MYKTEQCYRSCEGNQYVDEKCIQEVNGLSRSLNNNLIGHTWARLTREVDASSVFEDH